MGEEQGNPSLLFQQGRIFVKVMVLVLINEKPPFGISIHPRDFGRNAIFTVNCGGQRAVNMEHLAPNSFLSDEAKRIWKPKTLGNNPSRPKSNKMSPTAATLREE